jgi:FkbM family methyltransferase
MVLDQKLEHYAREVRSYWAECCDVRSFVRLMRVRLSQSKVGRLVTPRPILVTVDLHTLGPSVRLRSHTTDISVLKELVVGGGYESLPADLAATSVVDLGANTGLTHRWLRRRYPDARFVCVEPDPENLTVLRFNVGAVDPDAVVVAACIGGRERDVALVGGDGEWGYRMADVAGGTIPVLTMDRVLAEAGLDRVDVLKCDVEGAEAELFAECAGWVGGVQAMIVECHTDVITTDELQQVVADNGGRFTVANLESTPSFGCDVVTLTAA